MMIMSVIKKKISHDADAAGDAPSGCRVEQNF